MPSYTEIGPPVPDMKISKGFLPYMAMVAILVMWPGLFIYTLVPPSYRCFISNLALIGQAVSDKRRRSLKLWTDSCRSMGIL